MEENYVEWLVKRKDPVYALPAKVLIVIVVVLSVFSALRTVLGVVFMTLAAIAAYFLFINLSIEYEYLFAEGGLRIDRIMGRARRKKAFDCEKADIQFIAPADSYKLKDYESAGIKVQDYSSGQKGAKVYAVIYQKGSEHMKVLIEPNEKMISAMRRSFPSKMLV
ncbi:DUF6106 family protein [Lacrimispora sp. 210928-DFI.3.58]|uniref:DUF6106 family protein n=1 Tax=Lacrimispora sp. 210928-DFI.3.58 TaxID=2883214 RepID=UPI0015B48A60|nr:DUF6106 family protein [Lacrimispora sp. 210928-DFI.3.58]MCB7318376.1 DUF6106 family protein [Lacrimispora sp. 210928-DFI.3.58]